MRRLVVGIVAAAEFAACGGEERAPAPATGAASAVVAQAAPGAQADDDTAPPGDADRGKKLVLRFECNRCHDGTGFAAAAQDRHCVRCHQDILAGRFSAPADTLARWRGNLVTLREVPSLVSIGAIAKRAWIERFLIDPRDVRPHLASTMPRLAITRAEAHDVAAYLTRDAHPAPPVSLAGADPARGRALVETRGCGGCHELSGAAPLPGADQRPAAFAPDPRTQVALAPDLRFTRDRLGPAELVRWLLDPKAQKPDTVMPSLGLTPAEARDVAAYLITAPLAPEAPRPHAPRLPLLARRVSFEEVELRVLRKTCRHCHSEPDYALGDGGPGNSGGLGFAPRGLNLGSYGGVAAGSLDDHGERRSVFTPQPNGASRLVGSLLARQDEEAGRPDPNVRGMPLGLPAVTPEELQIVESWVAQGRPQ